MVLHVVFSCPTLGSYTCCLNGHCAILVGVLVWFIVEGRKKGVTSSILETTHRVSELVHLLGNDRSN